MDYKEAKEALTMCRELMLYDPNNGVSVEYDDLNEENRKLYDACGVAVWALTKKEESQKIVVVKHSGDNGHYLFSVPAHRDLKQGDMVMVKNKRGEATAKCVCDSFEVNESVLKALAARYGATLPLAPIIGTMKPEWW